MVDLLMQVLQVWSGGMHWNISSTRFNQYTKFLRFADQDKKPNICEVVMAYQTMKQELRSFFGTNVSTLKEYIEVVDERLSDVFIGTYVGPDKHTRVVYF